MSTSRRSLLAGAAVAVAGTAARAGPARLSPAVTPALTGFICGAAERSWPAEVVDLAKHHLLDTLAAQVACRDLDAAVLARRLVTSGAWGRGDQARLVGGRERASLTGAAFANAMAGHAAEINDFSPSAFVQPGPSVVSVCLSVAETQRLSGRAVLGAMIAGYEIACRMPKALGVRNLRRAGLANHAIGPTFGCGAAAAALLGLSPAQAAAVLSYCAEQASGSWQWLLDTSHVEKAFVFAGLPARNGLEAALMAQAGFSGVTDALDRPGGWMESGVFGGPDSDLDRGYLTERLGERFELPLVGYKRFPTGGPTQPAVQAMLSLAPKVAGRPVLSVRVEMPGEVAPFRSAEMPALNIPYLMAIILKDGRLDFVSAQSRARMAGDPAIGALMARVEVVSDPAQVRTPRAESARVTVRLADETLSAFVPQVAGFPGHLLSRAEVTDKALDLMTPRLGRAGARRVCDAALGLHNAATVGPLLDAVTP